MTIALSTDAVTAEIQALTAMRNFIDGKRAALTDDHADAVKTAAGTAFMFIIMRLAANVVTHSVEPADYYQSGSDDLIMSVELQASRDVPDGTAAVIRRQMEHAVACRALHLITDDNSYRETADGAVDTIRDLLAASDSPIARILPSR